MNDLISRAAALDALKNSRFPGAPYVDSGISIAIGVICDLPPAQPERIRGKWKKISPATIYECSVCGQTVMTDDIEAYSYCHGCGAKMEVVK